MTYDPNNKWEIETPDEAKACSHCDAQDKPVFVLSAEVMGVIKALCKEIKREWQVILIGEETKTGIYCHDYVITEQETGAAVVYNKADITKEFLEEIGAVATCHSHGEIGVGFSHTDEVCTNFSWIKHHMVTNNKGHWAAISRFDLPCGMVKMKPAVVQIEIPVPEAKDIKGLEKIGEVVYTPTKYAGFGESYGCYGAFKHTYGGKGAGYYKPEPVKGEWSQKGTQPVVWKRGCKRVHAFSFDQTGGCYGY